MAAAPADASNSVSAAETEQLTAPAGWTKKLVPAKAKYITLRKHDVVFIAPDGQEIPSQWHLRRYLKAHPEGPALSEFNWSSGEESIRRSARASAKEVSYSERTPRSKGKRNAAEIDAEGTEEDKAKTTARKRAKKAGKEESSAVKESIILPDKDEVMQEASEGAVAGGILDTNYDAGLETAVQKDEGDTGTGNFLENAKQVATEAAVNVAGGGIHEEQKVEEVTEQVVEVTAQVEEVTEQVVEVKEHVVEVKEQVVVTTSIELQEEFEPKEASGVNPLVAPANELKGEEPVVESEKPLEPSNVSVVESKEPLDQNLEVRKDAHDVVEGDKGSLELLMQKEEQERLPSVHLSPLKVEHIKEKSPNELSSSPAPVSVVNQ